MSKLHSYNTIFFTFMNSSAAFQHSINKEEKYYHWQLVSLVQQESQNRQKLNQLIDWFFTTPHAQTSAKAQHCLLSSPQFYLLCLPLLSLPPHSISLSLRYVLIQEEQKKRSYYRVKTHFKYIWVRIYKYVQQHTQPAISNSSNPVFNCVQ